MRKNFNLLLLILIALKTIQTNENNKKMNEDDGLTPEMTHYDNHFNLVYGNDVQDQQWKLKHFKNIIYKQNNEKHFNAIKHKKKIENINYVLYDASKSSFLF